MSEPHIGDDVKGVITTIIPPDRPSGKPKVLCDVGLPGWTCAVQFNAAVAKKRDLLRVGDHIAGWVIRKHADTFFLAIGISDFGRYPPKPETLTRYINAVTGIRGALASSATGNFRVPDAEAVSATKGLLSRCVKKDQWDWLVVYRAFDFSDDGEACRTRDCFLMYQEACKNAAKGKVAPVSPEMATKQLLESGFLARLDGALRNFSAEQKEWDAVKAPTPSRSSAHEPRPSALEPAVPLPPYASLEEARASLARQAFARVQTERASAVHDVLTKTMSSCLAACGMKPFYNGLIDLYCDVAGSTHIFEMKSTTPQNQLSQIRKAVSQLYEYRFLHGMDRAKLVIVLDRRPDEPWVIEYLLQDREILICWLVGDRFECPDAVASGMQFCCEVRRA